MSINFYQSHTSFAKVAKRSNSFLHFAFQCTLPYRNTSIDEIRNFCKDSLRQEMKLGRNSSKRRREKRKIPKKFQRRPLFQPSC